MKRSGRFVGVDAPLLWKVEHASYHTDILYKNICHELLGTRWHEKRQLQPFLISFFELPNASKDSRTGYHVHCTLILHGELALQHTNESLTALVRNAAEPLLRCAVEAIDIQEPYYLKGWLTYSVKFLVNRRNTLESKSDTFEMWPNLASPGTPMLQKFHVPRSEPSRPSVVAEDIKYAHRRHRRELNAADLPSGTAIPPRPTPEGV